VNHLPAAVTPLAGIVVLEERGFDRMPSADQTKRIWR
jgi:hypothetical protein